MAHAKWVSGLWTISIRNKKLYIKGGSSQSRPFYVLSARFELDKRETRTTEIRIMHIKLRHLAMTTAMLCTVNLAAQSQKEWRDSLETLNKQIALSPSSVELRLRKAAVNVQLQQWEYAINEYTDILLQQPDNIAALYFRAFARNNLRRYEPARSDYESVLKLAPHNFEARLGLAYTLVLLNKQADALEQMNRLVEQHPDSATAYAARAGLERDLKQYAPSLFDWGEAMRLDPDNADYAVSKVDVLLTLGKKSEAKAILDEQVKRGVPRGTLIGWYKRCK